MSPNSVTLINVFNPSLFIREGGYQTPVALDEIPVQGQFPFVVGNETMLVLDISSITAPVLVGQFPTSGYGVGLGVFGDYANVADIENLKVFDVSDQSMPILAGSFNHLDRARS